MRATIFIDTLFKEFELSVRKGAYKYFEFIQIQPCNECGLITAWHNVAIRPSSGHFVCYITETKTPADADVSYALFCARIPVLTLKPCEVGLSSLLFSPANLSSNGQEHISTSLDELLDLFFPQKCDCENGVLVLEGGDGAGKQTQTKLLLEHLRAKNVSVQTLDFPRENAPYGGLIRAILSGKKGGISDLDPKLFSFIYSLNRYGCLPELRLWMQHRQVVVCDRYYTANFGHQAAKLPEDKRIGFIQHLEALEVNWLTLPPAKRVFYLDLQPLIAMKAMQGDLMRKYLDIHETASDTYKKNVRQTFLWCCNVLNGWKCISCCDRDGRRRFPEELHEEIYNDVGNLGVFQSFAHVK
ncbi:unnamed protein product [Phytomonas sp. Hart1]|nr:unnamed protein product [Phytomonas sp. Hart1]|eukprot:CCW71419.1 unnamed protein product [Phytomonas sp. isolate Hart1]